MFRNKLIVLCLLVAGGCLIFGEPTSEPLIKTFEDQKSLDITAVPIKEEVSLEVSTIIPIPRTSKKTTTSTSTTTTTTTTTTSTTTAAPITSTTTTTTVAPTTAHPTTAEPTPAPTPAPIPEPVIGKWNSSCILLQMAAQLNFTYETSDKKNTTAIYNIPSTAVVHDATCDSKTHQQIVLTWGPADAVHSLTIQFEHNDTKVNVEMIMFNLPIDAVEFPNAKANQTMQMIYRGDILDAPYKMSYHCTRAQKFNLTETIADEITVGVLRISDVQIEAFRTDSNSTQFSTARDCDSSETPDIVPIAVGIALAVLILIVLISYLCARRRSTARGYMSF